MSVAALAAPPVPAPRVRRTPHLFSVEDFYKMAELGLFAGRGRVELIEGQVFRVMPPNPPHANVVDVLGELLEALVPAGWRARSRLSVRLSTSSPLPDACVARGDRTTYRTRHPNP